MESFILVHYRCSDIPPAFLDKNLAKKHFGCFGTIKSFSLRPNRLLCMVEYETAEQASLAKQNAGNYKGLVFGTEFTSSEPKPPTPDPDIDPDVQSELQALRELSRGSAMGKLRKFSMRSTINLSLFQVYRQSLECSGINLRYRLARSLNVMRFNLKLISYCGNHI